ncbi:MAG TPA: pilus assembly protein PilM, partial [Phycisphaerae bacterium]|nr:pilus assembly protein PilM [Phycisphaerae bacterium]
MTKTKNLPIGVDLGTSSVKMAQMRVSDDGLAMTAAALCEIPRNRRDPPQTRMDFLAGAIRENLKSHPFLGNECILSLPAEATVIQHVKLPKLPPQEIPKALRTELQGKLPFSGSDAIIR